MKQSTREKILDAVFSLIYIHGYNGTSISMILKECKIPKGSFYHYFKTKKDVVLSVIKERLHPKMDEFYDLQPLNNEHPIDTISRNILKAAEKNELILYGCPLNRLNQQMSFIDEEFEMQINNIYKKIKDKIVNILQKSSLKNNIDIETLSEFIITSVWGSLSLSPKNSSKEKYINSIKHLITYLNTLK